MDKLKVDVTRKRKIESIIKYCRILEEAPPHIADLASVSEENLEKIHGEYFKKAKNEIGLVKF